MIHRIIHDRFARYPGTLTCCRRYAIARAAAIILVSATFIISCTPQVTVKRIHELALYPPTTKVLDPYWKEFPKQPYETIAMMRVRDCAAAEDILQQQAKELGADAIVFMGIIKIDIDFPVDYDLIGSDPYFEAYEVDRWAIALKYN